MELNGNENGNLSLGLENPPKGNSNEPSTVSWSKKIDQKEDFELILASPTPEKKAQRPLSQRAAVGATVIPPNNMVDIPEKYKIIMDFFDQMICSIRLLNLRNKPTTFSNISSQLEVLTKRNFQYSHLAQTKYLFPEAIEINKILIHDKTSLCMVPELKISLSPTFIEGLCAQGKSLALVLRQDFHSRLLNFIGNHQELVEIPEAALPEHFDTRKQSISEAISEEVSKQSECIEDDTVSSTSLLLPSFIKQCLSDKYEETCCQGIDGFFQTSGSIVKLPSSPKEGEHRGVSVTTPIKPLPSSGDLQVLTPAPRTPKIPNTGIPDEKGLTKMKASVQSARRSLFYSPSKIDSNLDVNLFDVELSNSKAFPSHNMIAIESTSTQVEQTGKASCSYEMRNVDGDSSVASEYQKMVTSLPDLFDTIRSIIKSISRYTITRQELLNKVVQHNFAIDGLDQAEELLNLMEQTIPHWISTKTTPSGDLLCSIERVCDIESVRAKLVNTL